MSGFGQIKWNQRGSLSEEYQPERKLSTSGKWLVKLKPGFTGHAKGQTKNQVQSLLKAHKFLTLNLT